MIKEITIEENMTIEDVFEEIGCMLIELSAFKDNCPDVIFEDQGIGSYEFWGAKCVDSDVQPVWDECSYELKVTNFKKVIPELTKEVDEEIGKLLEFVNDDIRYTFTAPEGSDFEYFEDVEFQGILSLDIDLLSDAITFIVDWKHIN